MEACSGSRIELIKYIKIYKALCYGPLINMPAHNINVCQNYISLFDDDYNYYNDLDKFINFCKDNNINSVNDIQNIITSHIKSNKHYIDLINNYIIQDKLPKSLINIPNDKKFVKLDNKKTYLSIDLTHAFSQYVDSLNILPDKFDKLFIDTLPYQYLKNIKKIRIFIYTQCYRLQDITNDINDNHIINLLLSILSEDNELINKLNKYNITPVSYNRDELIFDITDYKDEFVKFVGDHTINNLNVHITIFNPHHVNYHDIFTDTEKTFLIKTDYITGKNHIAYKQNKFITQLYKAFKGLPILDEDLYIIDNNNYNHRIVKLKQPIKIISIE